MKKTSKLLIYKLIIDKVRKNPCTFKEIEDYLADTSIHDEDMTISKRTFNRYQQEILHIFGIHIDYNPKLKVYEIEFSESEEVSNRLIEALDTFTALNMDNSIKKYIELEQTKVAGTENLHTILRAVKEKKVIVFNYHKYWDDIHQVRTLQPYFIKEQDNRWYVIGKDSDKNEIRTFGLDRIKDLFIQGNTFSHDRNFNRKDYFKHSFGVNKDSDKHQPKKLILEFNAKQGRYVKSLPLHSSQTILEDTKEKLVIELNLLVTFDFYQKLMSYGETLKVIEPIEVKQELIRNFSQAIKNYQDENH